MDYENIRNGKGSGVDSDSSWTGVDFNHYWSGKFSGVDSENTWTAGFEVDSEDS